jgi:hypothetical protein
VNHKFERRYNEDEIKKGLKLWFGESQLQTSNPDRYDYLPGMLDAIHVANEPAPEQSPDAPFDNKGNGTGFPRVRS